MTCAHDGREHLVTQAAFTAGVHARFGSYRALCGHLVLAAPLTCAAGHRCGPCAQRRRGTALPARTGMHKLAAILRRATAAVPEQFAADPLAPHSGQFPLGRHPEPAGGPGPSPAGTRPWALRAMHPARQQGDPVRRAFRYDHERQIAVDHAGTPLTVTDATANKVTNNDGDEGPSEDFTYDYCPDAPLAA